MFGVDLDEPQACFMEQTGLSSPTKNVGEDTPVSGSVLSKSELKKKQQEALKTLIAEDLGHTSSHENTLTTSSTKNTSRHSLIARVHHAWTVLTSQSPPQAAEQAATQDTAHTDVPDVEDAPVAVSFLDQVAEPIREPEDHREDAATPLAQGETTDSADDFSVFAGLADDAADTGQPTATTPDQKKQRLSLPRVQPHTIVLTGVGLVATIIVGILMTGGHAQQVGRDCTSAVSAYEKTYSTYTSHLAAARTLLDSTDTTSVVDATLLGELSGVVKNPVTKMAGLSCTVGSFDTQAADRTLTRVHGATDDLTAAQKKIRDLEKSIGASIQAKKLIDAKTAAQAKLDEATSLYSSSNGQVADNTTRDTLKTQIDALDAALKDKKATVETLSEKMQEAQSAIDQVNSSVQAKKDADAQAAAAAAQAQAQAQAQQQAQAQSVPVVPRSRSGSSGGAVPRRSSPSTPSVPSSSPSWSVPSDPGEAYLPGSLN
ncbi:hypothetical protein QP232_02195 [Alloscardovia omnicolens]|uniref:hypothetical protein n=1 Tax=Alloscardovia omnicolens TaxID=419015 RepID=UPI00254E0427|nr:hypothetical protein [Alloscardovia omnicolens]MDK6663297.1 hypothetical protein [Alloscardovia omnicolens]MDK7747211.1 hypothetical protein [Alloscardovia omnicolens]